MAQQFIDILGNDYYKEFNIFANRRHGKNLEDVHWRDRSCSIREMIDYLLEKFNINIQNTGKSMVIFKEYERSQIVSIHPSQIITKIDKIEGGEEFSNWLTAIRLAMDNTPVQKSLF